MNIYKGENFSQVFPKMLSDLYDKSNRVANTYELENVTFQIENTKSCLIKNNIHPSKTEYIKREFEWYLNGNYNVNELAKYAKLWHSVSDDGYVNSNYGKIIKERNSFGETPWSWCVKKLLQDMNTRKAILHFSSPIHNQPFTKDYVCCMYAMFTIRNGRLNMKVSFRSNDVIFGLMNDIAWFSLLHQNMFNIIKKYYNIKLGTYTHSMDSLHLYEKHFNKVEEMLYTEIQPKELNIKDLILYDGHGLIDKEGYNKLFETLNI